MKREEFVAKVSKIKENNSLMSEEGIRTRIHVHADSEKDIPVCIGELSELILELTRHQRGKMDPMDFLQELSHVQWAVWSLQDALHVLIPETVKKVHSFFGYFPKWKKSGSLPLSFIFLLSF